MERMLDLNKKKAAEKNPNILDPLETQIAGTLVFRVDRFPVKCTVWACFYEVIADQSPHAFRPAST